MKRMDIERQPRPNVKIQRVCESKEIFGRQTESMTCAHAHFLPPEFAGVDDSIDPNSDILLCRTTVISVHPVITKVCGDESGDDDDDDHGHGHGHDHGSLRNQARKIVSSKSSPRWHGYYRWVYDPKNHKWDAVQLQTGDSDDDRFLVKVYAKAIGDAIKPIRDQREADVLLKALFTKDTVLSDPFSANSKNNMGRHNSQCHEPFDFPPIPPHLKREIMASFLALLEKIHPTKLILNRLRISMATTRSSSSSKRSKDESEIEEILNVINEVVSCLYSK